MFFYLQTDTFLNFILHNADSVSTDKQRRIVARIEELTRRVEEAKKVANEALAELSTFTPALLAKAFRGEM